MHVALPRPDLRLRTVATAGALALVAIYVYVLFSMITRGDTDASTGLIIAPILVVLTLPAIWRQSIREGDRKIIWFLVAVLLLKIIGAVVRYYITFEVYDRADAIQYHLKGVELFGRFQDGNFSNTGPVFGTNFIGILTGGIYALIGPERLSTFIVFSWLGFLGVYFYYRAFITAVPEGRARSYGRLIFLLPTLLYWPSSIGKEAWMTFALGIAVFGVARILSGSARRGFPILALGLWLSVLVRPHLAGMVALSLAAAATFAKTPGKARQLAPVLKLLSLAAIIAAVWLVTMRATTFLQDSGVPTDRGIASALDQITARTNAGGSEFTPPVVRTPLDVPVAVVTVLFRPFPFEVNNMQALATSLEGTFILALTFIRWGSVTAAFRSMRRRGYLLFVAGYVVIFSIAHSGVANFGLLARQRAQILPMYLVLLCLPRRRTADDQLPAIPERTPAWR